MSKIKTMIKLWKEDKSQIKISLYNNIVHTKITNLLSDKAYLKLTYKIRFGKKLDLDNPKTYNEKLQWLKLYDRNPKYTTMVDKIKAKEYVADIIGKDVIIPTLGVYDKFDDIDFDKLPDSFVIKCNHDSGSVIVCKDKKKLNISNAKKIINKGLKYKPFYWGREWPYKDVKPKILVEKYMEDAKDKELRDYKFFCFNGVCKLLFIASNRQGEGDTYFDFFDIDFNHLPFLNGHPNAPKLPHKPKNYKKMIEYAEKLSKGIAQVRVDFYEVNGKVYFGELTFSHWSGFVPFDPEEWDYKIGDMIDLDVVKKHEN